MERGRGNGLTRDAEAKFIRVVGKEAFEEGAFADARGARHDEGPDEVCGGRHGGHLRENKGRAGRGGRRKGTAKEDQ